MTFFNMADLPFFLLLFCSLPFSSSSPDTNTPTLSEAVRIIQVNAIEELNQKIVEQEALIKNKEDESRVLKNVIEQQKTEVNTIPGLKNEISNQKLMMDKMKEEAKEKEKKISGLETKFKDSGVLVKFMMTVLKHSEEVMILRENMITAQGLKLKEYKNQNEVLIKNQELQTEIITNQNKAKANIKKMIVTDKQLISSYTEYSKPSGKFNCEVVPFIAGLANTLSKQKTEIRNLKTVLKTESKIAEHLEKMAEEMTKLSNEENDWDAAIKYQTIIKAQSNGIRQVTTLANFIKMSGQPFKQDDAGNIILGHPQCMMDYTTWTEDWRVVNYSTQAHADRQCDQAPASSSTSGLTSGWHRFVFNGVHARIPTHAPASKYQGWRQTCGADVASWMDGSLPSLGQPPKDVTMKFSGNGKAEYSTSWRKPAKVVACLDENHQTFYLYHLVPVEGCSGAYCATTVF